MDEREEVTLLYRTLKAERQQQFETLARQDVRVSNARLATFGVGILLAWLAFHELMLSAWWLLVPCIVFVALMIWHDRLLQQKTRSERAVAFYEAGLARMEDRWMGRGSQGDRFLKAAHPYALDLDLFGSGSLFELLCTARTQFGEECLADWLCTPAASPTIRARQEAVRELAERLELREEMAIRGIEIRSGINSQALTVWGNAPIALPISAAFGVALVLAALSLIALVLWGMGYGTLPLMGMVLVGGVFDAVFGKRVKQIIRSAERPRRDLELFAEILAVFEQETFASELLRTMQTTLNAGETSPSKRILRLRKLVEYLESQSNFLFAPLAFLLRWSFLFAYLIERWREHDGANLALWLRTVGEFEALCALGSFTLEHPDSVFPELVETGICLEAEGLAHPLLPASGAVRNAMIFDAERRLYIVSGSNMSGKSTLLRTVGTNAILAFMGSPVLATRLRIAPLHLAASIRTQDSLQAGVSRFYAEIKRLRQVVDVAREQPPCLFLLDEILHGTNSHDRRIGAEAILRALVSDGAIGLVTTHDLALARIAEDADLHAVNVHFQDHMENGQMLFDYRLRSGVVEKSNALELMRAVGLEIPLGRSAAPDAVATDVGL